MDGVPTHVPRHVPPEVLTAYEHGIIQDDGEAPNTDLAVIRSHLFFLSLLEGPKGSPFSVQQKHRGSGRNKHHGDHDGSLQPAERPHLPYTGVLPGRMTTTSCRPAYVFFRCRNMGSTLSAPCAYLQKHGWPWIGMPASLEIFLSCSVKDLQEKAQFTTVHWEWWRTQADQRL